MTRATDGATPKRVLREKSVAEWVRLLDVEERYIKMLPSSQWRPSKKLVNKILWELR